MAKPESFIGVRRTEKAAPRKVVEGIACGADSCTFLPTQKIPLGWHDVLCCLKNCGDFAFFLPFCFLSAKVDQMPASDGSESQASTDDDDERNPEAVREDDGEDGESQQQTGVAFGNDRQTKTSPSLPSPVETVIDSSHPAAVRVPFPPTLSVVSVIKGGSPSRAVVAALEAAVSSHVKSPARLSAAVLEGVGNASSLGTTFAAEGGEVAVGAVLRASAEGGVPGAAETVRGPVGRRRNR